MEYGLHDLMKSPNLTADQKALVSRVIELEPSLQKRLKMEMHYKNALIAEREECNYYKAAFHRLSVDHENLQKKQGWYVTAVWVWFGIILAGIISSILMPLFYV